jgi:uncharacterized protein YpmB
MIIVKIFLIIIVVVTTIYLIVTYERDKSKERASPIEKTVEIPLGNVEPVDPYIVFRLNEPTNSSIWEFPLSHKMKIIGRATDEFEGNDSIQRDHLGFWINKDGTAEFITIKGSKNPIYVKSNNKWISETNRFRLEKNKTNVIRIGRTEFEVYFQEKPPSGLKSNEKRTRIWEHTGL